ncbi:uncharacterized protein [Glycine max]|uniref:uncharacterized protein isoform X3 n=1 Tax=Glycine max TaxID=3847 RepID=UPI001B35814B|nr:uncharacterized protein LOC100799982 isoform X3 [Glycine max]
MAVSFIQEVEGYKIQSHIGDQWVWAADPSGQYSIRSAYSVLREDISEEAQDGEFKELWKLKVPPKVAVFAWRLLKDRLPTRDNLRRKQVELHEYLCPFCRTMEESACHLFFHCRKVLPVWWESLSWVNLQYGGHCSGCWQCGYRRCFVYHTFERTTNGAPTTLLY